MTSALRKHLEITSCCLFMYLQNSELRQWHQINDPFFSGQSVLHNTSCHLKISNKKKKKEKSVTPGPQGFLGKHKVCGN